MYIANIRLLYQADFLPLNEKYVTDCLYSLCRGKRFTAEAPIHLYEKMNTEEIIKSLEEELGIILIRTQLENVLDDDFCFANEVHICRGMIISLGICKLDISALPKSLGQAIDLKYLTIDNCVNLIHFESLANLKDLDGLRLCNLSIVSLPSEISNLPNLKKIYLKSNSFLESFNSLAYLFNLEELYLEDLEIKKLPQEIRCNKKLKKIALNFSENLFDYNVLKFIKNTLEYFEITFEKYSRVPKIVRNFKNLKVFFMKTTYGFKDISNLKKLRHLKEITLAGLKTDALPKSINTLKNLEVLRIYEADPINADKLKGLKNLKHLIGTKPPKYAYTLKKLETLEAASYDLTDVSMIKNLKRLSELSLRVHQAAELPEELFTCSNLISLAIEANLEYIPESVSKLEKLEELTLRNCMNLKDIQAINKLKNLQLLRIFELTNRDIERQILPRENLHLDIRYID